MRIRKFIHSCLLLEKGPDRILFDPGKFSFSEEAACICGHDHKNSQDDFMTVREGELLTPGIFTGITAVLVTHSHPDHLDADALKVILSNNPQALLYGNDGIAQALKEHDLAVEVFNSGTRQIGDFRVDAYPARHENIVAPEIPPNTAFIVDENMLNPGDSYAYSLDSLRDKFRTLALPVMAPWATELEAVGFAARMGARRIIPIHDGYARNFFLRMRYANFERHFGAQGVKFERMENAGAEVDL